MVSKKKKSTDPNKKPFAETVAEGLIEALKAGKAPWVKPWEPGQPNGLLPFNPTKETRYKGINSIILMATAMNKGYLDTRWLTFNQAKTAGAKVKAGEKGTQIQFWSFTKEVDKTDEGGEAVKDNSGKTQKQTVALRSPFLKFYTVFNAEQIEGLEPLVKKDPPKEGWAQLERAENIVKMSGAVVVHDQEDRAFYTVAHDRVHMPQRHQFSSSADYYATLLHEIGHWTGSPTRLSRDLTGSFGSESYAKEELRAEIASMIIGSELGIGHNPENHVAYIESWIRALQNDPMEIFRASADAEKIFAMVMGFENDNTYQKDPEADSELAP